MTTRRISESARTIVLGNEASLRGEELTRGLERDDVVEALVGVFTAQITSTGVLAGGMPDAAITALLASIKTDFVILPGMDGQRRPFPDLTQNKLYLLQLQAMEEVMTAKTSTVTGFKKAFIIGSNTVTWASALPLGRYKALRELGLVGGAGKDLLDLCQLTYKSSGEPLAALGGGLTLTSLSFEMKADLRRGNGAQFGCIPECLEKLTSKDGLLTDQEDGCYLVAWDDDAALAATTLGRLNRTVGDKPVGDDKQTPAEVAEDYARNPDVGSAEYSITDTVTPLYLTPEVPMATLRTGPLSLQQVTKTKDWNVTTYRLPVHPARFVGAVGRAVAAKYKRNGEGDQVLAVSNVGLHGVNLPPRLWWAAGFTLFKTSERQGTALPGLRFTAGAEAPELHIPQPRLEVAAYEYRKALELTDETARLQAKDEAIQGLAKFFPAISISGRGLSGPVSPVYAALVSRVEAAAREL